MRNARSPKGHFTSANRPLQKEPNIQLDLPQAIAAYFTADRGDAEAVSQCFTETAVVKDEGRTYYGRAAIKQWKADASAKYQYTSEPFACERKDGTILVTSQLSGNFPGSPVNLRFFFGLEGDKIASLEITP
jgi:hypothetical protein